MFAGALHRDMGQHCYHQATVTADHDRAAAALGSQAADVITQARQLTAPAAISYARRSRGQRQRPDHGWDSLTPTEREVAQLVAEGLFGDIRARILCRCWSRSWLAYSSMAPPACRRCRRKVYDGSAARRARYSSKAVCWRRV